MRRYERYKDTKIEWLGQIPHHWEIKKLRYLFNFNTGLSVTKAEFVDDGIKCINYGDIHTKYSFKLNLTNAILPKIDKIFLSQKLSCLLSENDLVFCDTSEDLDGVGNCVVISNLNSELLLSGSHTIVAKSIMLLDAVFIRYVLMSKTIKSTIENKVTGIKVFSITQGILNNISVTYPPLLEQQLIAEYLDQQTTKIDDLVQKQNKLIELLQEKKKSLINHVVTKGLNPYIQMKDSGIEWLGQIPEPWGVNKVMFIFSTNTDVLAENTNPDFEINYVDISSVTYESGIHNKQLMSFVNAPSRARKIVNDGDIIISTVRTYLRAITQVKSPENNLIVSTGFAVFSPIIETILSSFASYMCVSEYFVNVIVANSDGVSYPSINAEKLKQITVAIPPINEQLQIAEYLDKQTVKIDQLINKAKSMVELLKEHKQSLINNVVTGKIKVIQ